MFFGLQYIIKVCARLIEYMYMYIHVHPSPPPPHSPFPPPLHLLFLNSPLLLVALLNVNYVTKFPQVVV